jgi:hypothetical protein
MDIPGNTVKHTALNGNLAGFKPNHIAERKQILELPQGWLVFEQAKVGTTTKSFTWR